MTDHATAQQACSRHEFTGTGECRHYTSAEQRHRRWGASSQKLPCRGTSTRMQQRRGNGARSKRSAIAHPMMQPCAPPSLCQVDVCSNELMKSEQARPNWMCGLGVLSSSVPAKDNGCSIGCAGSCMKQSGGSGSSAWQMPRRPSGELCSSSSRLRRRRQPRPMPLRRLPRRRLPRLTPRCAAPLGLSCVSSESMSCHRSPCCVIGVRPVSAKSICVTGRQQAHIDATWACRRASELQRPQPQRRQSNRRQRPAQLWRRARLLLQHRRRRV